ncbi:hypothetical protein QO003_002542 [Arthrobacter silviterrae]|uniref:PH domain-containing protein n=1 Tax=Arthrobacter silviterrae TaxID=2026658 RepID=A0ABX0DIN5_9MICC|nr:PH domain-containing protein [Arthrobacter silviterrae]MDQ0278239.1 hypothetical protein [Arthrobacter silviterrae]NGN84500.1 PH domain-containing protein [Arthrobacter silviterrae]
MGPVAASLHSTPTRALAVVAWLFCAFFALNLLMTGTPAGIWHFLPWLLLVAWALFVLLWRPRLEVRQGGLAVVNLLREHTVPFGALRAVRVAQNVSLDTASGRIVSWGAPGAGKLGPKMLTGTGGARTMASLPCTQAAVEAAWDAWERAQADGKHLGKHDGGASSAGGSASQPGPEQSVTRRWNVPVAVVGVLLLLLSLAGTVT